MSFKLTVTSKDGVIWLTMHMPDGPVAAGLPPCEFARFLDLAIEVLRGGADKAVMSYTNATPKTLTPEDIGMKHLDPNRN